MKRAPRSPAFTLIEVLLAMSVLTTALVLTFHGFSNGMRAAKLSERYTVAAMLAQRKLAELEAADTIETASEEGDFEEDGVDDYPEYRWATEVAESQDVGNLYEATVSILWTDRGQERKVEVVRLFASRTTEQEQ